MSIRSDPFMKMAEANKTYGFTIAVKELRETVPNIFRYASAYKRKKGLKSKGLWEMFLEDPFGEENKDEVPKGDKLPEEVDGEKNPDVDPEAMEGERYNMCHFWSNFEIARLDFFRSREYEDFFEMMDRSGGFWMERVGVLMTCMFSFPSLTESTVGRCTNSLSRRRGSPGPERHSLFPRLRISTHYYSTLSRKRTCSTTGAHSIPGNDHGRREEAYRGRRVLGHMGSGQGEWRWLPLQV
jgi:hypothetical protein